MAERAKVFEIANIGLETTKGTGVAASKRLTSTMVTAEPQFDVSTYKATGYRYPTIATLSKEWMQATLEGPLSYTEMCYWLSSAIKKVTPTGMSPYTYTFTHSTTSAETVQSFTVEMGSAARAMKFVYGQLMSFNVTFNRNEATFRGTMFGKAIQDNITLTAGPTEIAQRPIMPTETTFYLADSAAGLAGASAMTRGFSVEMGMDNLFGQVYAMDGTSSFAADVDTEPRSTVTLLAAADATGMGLLTQVRAGDTKFLRVQSIGPVISGIDTYKSTLDLAMKITSVRDFPEEQGVVAVRWEGELTHDTTWGKAFSWEIVNNISAL